MQRISDSAPNDTATMSFLANALTTHCKNNQNDTNNYRGKNIMFDIVFCEHDKDTTHM